MMQRLVWIAVFLTVGLACLPSEAARVLKIATLAPERSLLGKALKNWATAVKNKTNNQVRLQIYYNGSQGDESARVNKMRSGQLDGALLTGAGLGKIHRPILALQMPGLFRTWPRFNNAAKALNGQFQQGVKGQGFQLASNIFGGGWVRVLSKGKAIRNPSDLKSMKVAMDPADPIINIYGAEIGYTPVRKSIPATLPAIQSGQANVVFATSMAANSLQWSPRMTHINASKMAAMINAVVLRKEAVDQLPGDKRLLNQCQKKVGNPLANDMQREDNQAFRARNKITGTFL